MVKGKTKLCSTPASGVSVESIGGIPFYDRYIEFERLLQKYVGDHRYKDSFAEPLFNGADGTIDWYVPAQYSEARRLDGLKGTFEYDDAVRRKDACLQYMKRLTLDMPDHDRKYFDCMLKFADSEISDFTSFVQGEHVILGVWGLQLHNGKDISMAIRTDIDDRRVYTITYTLQGQGSFVGCDTVIRRRHGYVLGGVQDIPNVQPEDGFEFTSWEPDAPHNKVVESDMTFTAICSPKPQAEVEPVAESVAEEPVAPEAPTFSDVRFDPGDKGKLKGARAVQAMNGKPLDPAIIPHVKPRRGYEFVGWDKDTTEPIHQDTVFKAQYQRLEGGGGFFGGGFGPSGWAGGRGGCLNWLIGLLLGLLLLFLLSLLLRMCSGPAVTEPVEAPQEETVTTRTIKKLPEPVKEGTLEKEKVTKETEVDYEAVRALIQEYQQRIDELGKMLPENEKK